VDTLSDILGDKITCSASAGWRADERVIEAKQGFGFRYNSDCRGQSLFQPQLAGGRLGAPQIPVDLPTFDEVVGPTVAAKDFNAFILDRFNPEKLNVYTIHAEVEGILMANDFRQLLSDAHQRDIRFQPLGDLLPETPDSLPIGRVVRGALEGREGWLGVQGA
jgi:undecaprenyl phosphate-alpha-L-ara4FN deformylase